MPEISHSIKFEDEIEHEGNLKLREDFKKCEDSM
jgi:hypothetical protein